MLCGCIIAMRLLPRLGKQTILWLGCCIGLTMAMWFPALFAFFLRFSLAAQCAGMVLCVILAVLSCAPAGRTRHVLNPKDQTDGEEDPPILMTLLLVLPFAALSAYLQATHTLQPLEDGLYVGQSTYGDLCLHLGIATGLRDAPFPPEYTLLPGTPLGYPFLMDALSSGMMLLGCSLRMSFVLPGTVFMFLVFWGFVIVCYNITKSPMATATAFLLTFLNGGLGFLYTLDFLPASKASSLQEALYGFYRTPTNQPDLNLRWSNIICDLMIPQRTILAGWMMFFPCLWLLLHGLRTKEKKAFVMLGILAGSMPMVHTHTFLALGLASAGVMGAELLREKESRGIVLRNFLFYGSIAVAIALPQLLTWTFPQTVSGGSLRLHFNWVNRDALGFRDGYFWFWIKNMGLVYILLLPAALNAPKHLKPLTFGALCIYAVAECVLFQPNDYDNNKLFYIAFFIMTPFVGLFLAQLHSRLSGIRGRWLLLAVFFAVSLISGSITVAREAISSYQLFSLNDVQAARFADESTPSDAIFLTGTQHNNPVAALAGRRIVCGTSLYLYFHGIDTSAQRAAVSAMYEDPAGSLDLFERYGVDYIMISDCERTEFSVDLQTMRSLFPIVWQEDNTTIFAVSERAGNSPAKTGAGDRAG